jgi:hypothetical protein
MAIVMPNTYFAKWNSSPENIMDQLYASYKKFGMRKEK